LTLVKPIPVPLCQHGLAHSGSIGRHQSIDLSWSQALMQRTRLARLFGSGGTGRDVPDRRVQSPFQHFMQRDDLPRSNARPYGNLWMACG
jgi:hypothetical protein